MAPEQEAVRARLVRLVVESGDGNFTADELAKAGGSLQALGYSSLSYIRLLDAIENELGVYVDPDQDIDRFVTVDDLLAVVDESREPSGA